MIKGLASSILRKDRKMYSYIYLLLIEIFHENQKLAIQFFTMSLIDKNGKTKAVNATIEGAAPVKRTRSPKPKQSYKSRSSKSGWKFIMLCLVLLIGIGSTLYKRVQSTGGQILSSSFKVTNFIGSFRSSNSSQQYTCSGKTHYSQMTSCAEAKFYIRNCPGTKIDGDGIPCERQWCN